MRLKNTFRFFIDYKIIFFFLVILFPLFISGCQRPVITEAEYSSVWQIYSSKEFEEGFFEKLSMEQKNRILRDVIGKTKIDFSAFTLYIKEHHPDSAAAILE